MHDADCQFRGACRERHFIRSAVVKRLMVWIIMAERSNMDLLRQCGWYYENLNVQDAHRMLENTSIGTFLVRNSNHPNFEFSSSVQTVRGPKSIRIWSSYSKNLYCFEGVREVRRSVVELVQYYVKSPHGIKWLQRHRIEFKMPLKVEPPTLLHLSNLAINRSIGYDLRITSDWPDIKIINEKHKLFPISPSLANYLNKYPFSI